MIRAAAAAAAACLRKRFHAGNMDVDVMVVVLDGWRAHTLAAVGHARCARAGVCRSPSCSGALRQLRSDGVALGAKLVGLHCHLLRQQVVPLRNVCGSGASSIATVGA
jgi:hypothetical protein